MRPRGATTCFRRAPRGQAQQQGAYHPSPDLSPPRYPASLISAVGADELVAQTATAGLADRPQPVVPVVDLTEERRGAPGLDTEQLGGFVAADDVRETPDGTRSPVLSRVLLFPERVVRAGRRARTS